MDSTLIEGMSNDMAGGLIAGGILGIGIGMIAIIAIIWYLLQAIANWKIFVKMGEPGWKGLIPVYNDYILYRSIWNVKMFVISYVLAILAGLSSVGEGTSVEIVFSVIAVVSAVALVVILIMHSSKLSNAFGHGTGFTLGLIFFEPVFKLILGFGSSGYIGNPAK